MDRVSEKSRLLNRFDCMENLIIQVLRQHDRILYALRELHSEHMNIMREEAGMMSVLMERIDELETTVCPWRAEKKKSDLGQASNGSAAFSS